MKRGSSRSWALAAALVAAPATADVPVTMANGYPLVPVQVAGGEHLFVLDTGAEGSAVYPAFAEAAALPVAPPAKLVGQTGEADLPIRTIAELSLDGRHVGPVAAVALPARGDGLALPGIIGLDVFGDRLLDLDIPRGRLALREGNAAVATVKPLGRPVRARRVAGGLLAVPLVLDGVRGWGVIDTGARQTRVNPTFARLARLVPDDGPAATIRGATQRTMAVSQARVRKARFLGRTFDGAKVGVADLPVFRTFGFADRPALLLGIDWLREHRLVIDFRTGSVWLR